jgi:hypothetical protein
MRVSRVRNDTLRNANASWLAGSQGRDDRKADQISVTLNSHKPNPRERESQFNDLLGGMKSTAMCEIAAGISKEELECRITIFDAGHYSTDLL